MPQPRQKISIALCTYNGGTYLAEQLDSFLCQTRLPDEMVVCDDGSTDMTVEIIRAFMERAPFPVRLFENGSNVGSSKNFEKAVSLCTGEVIFLSDQDDVWKADKIETILEVFDRSSDVGLVYSNASVVRSNLEPTGLRLWDTIKTPKSTHQALDRMGLKALLLHSNYVTGATAAFRSDVNSILKENPTPQGILHDQWIAILVATQRKIRSIDRDLILYRQHADQQIGAKPAPSVFSAGTPRPRKERFDKLFGELRDQHRAFCKLRSFLKMDREERGSEPSPGKLLKRKIEVLEKCLGHVQVRGSLAPHWYRRILPIVREVRNGGYLAYSAGLRSIVADLLRK